MRIPFKHVFATHPSITGSLFGVICGFISGVLNVPSAIFLLAPLFAGIIAGYIGGSGMKAGILTLLLPILVILTIPLVVPTVDWGASTMPQVSGVGPIDATLATLTNGLIRSTWSIAHGLATITSALAGILILILIIMIPIIIAVGIGVTAVLGFIGGKIGGTARGYFQSRRIDIPTSSRHIAPQQSNPLTNPICPMCHTAISASDVYFCPDCGAAIRGRLASQVSLKIVK